MRHLNAIRSGLTFWRREAAPVCYIHAGPHKTGTSSIQHYLATNEAWLAENDVVYPRLLAPGGRAIAHHGSLTAALRANKGVAIDFDSPHWRVVAKIAARRRQSILLSSEFFAGKFRDKRNLNATLEFFESFGYPVKVILHFRDQPIWINSWYMQTQKRFISRHSFDEFVRYAAKRRIVDPFAYLQNLIGNPRLTLEVASFEEAVKVGLERDFVARLGLDPASASPGGTIKNQNAGTKSVYAAQEIMRRTSVNVRKLPNYSAIYKQFRETYERLGWNQTSYVGLDDASCAAIRARYRVANERLAATYYSRPWAEICADRVYRTNVFDPSMATREEAEEVQTVVDEMVALIEASARIAA